MLHSFFDGVRVPFSESYEHKEVRAMAGSAASPNSPNPASGRRLRPLGDPALTPE